VSPVDYPARPSREGRRDAKRLIPSRRDDIARSFVAVFPPEFVLAALAELRRKLEISLPGVRWVAPGNLHFTLRFFGDLTREERTGAAEVLDAVVPARPVFPVELSGIGVFPDWRRPRILWVGASEGSEALVDLARSLEHGFREAGLGRADKPFVPHLTVGRWREGPPGAPEDAPTPWSSIGSMGAFPVVEVALIQSVLGPKGSTYTPLHRAALGSSGTA
jgi:2'-5' RNA ligase